MLIVAYQNLVQSIERCYYQHGLYCSSNAYRIISFTCFIIGIMSIGIFYSPLVHGNGIIEWRSSSSDRKSSENHGPQWLHSPPLASVQHFMIQLKHNSPFEAIQTMFSIQERIVSTKIITQEGSFILSDVCLQAEGQKDLMSGLPTNSTCMLLSPTQLWGNNMVDFLSDPDIPETILGDSSNPTVRALMFGTSWTTPPHPITLTLFLDPSLSSTVVSKFREAIINELSQSYSVSIFTEKEFKSDYIFMKKTERENLFGVEDERIHLFYSDKVNLLQLLPLAMLYVLVFIYIVISVRKITLVKSKVGLACVAVMTIVFSFVMSLGFCVFFDLLPTLTGSDIFPYIFTIVGLENVLTITRSVTITAGDQEVHIRIAQGLQTEGTKITKNVCGLALMFLVGICSPVPAAFHEFCVVGLVCVICDFFLQLFFFVPVLSLDIRRLELADLKSGPYPAPSIPINGKLPDWTDRPRKTKIFRHHAAHKILTLSVFLYVFYVIYHSVWSSNSEKNDKKLSLPGMIAVGSTRIINWILSMDYLQPKSQGDRSSYEKMFPHTFLATGSTVDMLDQSWRRAARDHWPILFKQYNIIVTARYFDIHKPIHIEDKGGLRQSDPITFQSHVRQWLQMPVTLHLISTVLGLISFLPIAILLYLSFLGLYKLLKPRSRPQSVKQKQDHPLLEVPFILSEHEEDIEHLAVHNNKLLTTSFDGLSVLWNLLSGKVLLKITSETIPWCTALSDKILLLGHGDGSVNVVNWGSNDIITVQQQSSGILLLCFIDQMSVLLCHENGRVIVIALSPQVINPPVGQDSFQGQMVEVKAEARIYPSSLIKYCDQSCQLAVCGGSNIVKVYDANSLTLRKVLQFPQSVQQLHLSRDMLLTCDNFSAVYSCDLRNSDLIEEYESKVGGISKILSTDDWIIGHLTDGPVLIWENSSSSYPHQLDVIAQDISLLHESHIIILQSDSIVLWSLREQQYLDDISLGRYISDPAHIRLKSSPNVAFVLDGPNVVPFTVLNS